MKTIIEKAQYRFRGGLKLDGHKQQSMQDKIGGAIVPEILTVPLQQHIGKPATPIVNVGDKVLKGQCIACINDDKDAVTAAIHAPSSGEVIALQQHIIPAVLKQSVECIVIKTDGKDSWHPDIKPVSDPLSLTKDQLKQIIIEAGIVGLGGAGFPTHLKLTQEKPVDTLIINAAECEPYITCDAVLIEEQAEKIIQGIQFILHTLDIKKCLIGTEDNKPQAIQALEQAINNSDINNITVVQVPTRYPAGGEKQLIQTLTGKQYSIDQLPRDLGIICHNIATAYAVANAILDGQPLIERVVTITGDNFPHSKNMLVRFGTSMHKVLESCGYQENNCQGNSGQEIIMGGPMMGIHLENAEYPVIKTTNCILIKNSKAPAEPLPCIRCGECARVCPASLLPQQLYWYARAKDLDRVQDYQIFSCIECGCCDYVCPSHIPLVQFYRYAKMEIWTQEELKKKSDHARERHEFRLLRIERKKKEDAERKAKKKALLNKKQGVDTSAEDTKKAAIEAALQRVKAKQTAVPKNTTNLTPEQQKKIREVDRRRHDKKDVQSQTNNKPKDDSNG